MSDERVSTTMLLKAVQFAAGKHQAHDEVLERGRAALAASHESRNHDGCYVAEGLVAHVNVVRQPLLS
jgi:hypothetical protein